MFKRYSLLFFCFLLACTSFPQHSSLYKNYSIAFTQIEFRLANTDRQKFNFS